MRIEEIHSKTLVRKSYPSCFGWFNYTLNPYQGCWHDCSYCDGKSDRYRMHDDFSSLIRVKTNAPRLLEKFLFKKGLKKNLFSSQFASPPTLTLFIGGGVCDVYQPIEKKVRLMRRLLQVAYDCGVPVCLVTKSDLVLEDLDLIKKINSQTYCSVNFTITLSDDSVQRIFEPRASSSSRRFECIEIIRKESIPAGIYFSPILPFIGDTNDNMTSIYTQAREVGAEFVYCSGLTLSPGKNKNDFFATIKKNYPHLLHVYKGIYGNNNKYGIPDKIQLKLRNAVKPVAKGFRYALNNHIDYAPPRYVPSGLIQSNLKMSETIIRSAYIHGSVLERFSKAKTLYSNARYIEDNKNDLLLLSKDIVSKLPLLPEVKTFILATIRSGHSDYLKKIETYAYNILSKKTSGQNDHVKV